PLVYAYYKTRLGQVYLARSAIDKAEGQFQEAIRYANKIQFDNNTAIEGLGDVALSRGQYQVALAAYEKALAVEQKRFANTGPDIRRFAHALFGLKRYQETLEFTRPRLQSVTYEFDENVKRPAINAIQSLQNTRSVLGLHIAAAFSLMSSQPELREQLTQEAFVAAQWQTLSAAALAVAQGTGRLATSSSSLNKLVIDYRDAFSGRRAVEENLTAQLVLPVEKRNEQYVQSLQARLDELDRTLGTLTQKLDLEYPEYREFSSPKPLTILSLQRLLRTNEVVWIYCHTDVGSFIWLIGKDRVIWESVSLSNAEVAQFVIALRCGLDAEAWEGIERGARCGRLTGSPKPSDEEPLPFHFGKAYELYRTLLDPFKDMIKGKHLLMVPSGPITSLPFHVLITKPPKVNMGKRYEDYHHVAWLARQQALTVLPSVSSLQALRNRAKKSPASKEYIGYGNPVLIGDTRCRLGTTPASCVPVTVASAETQRRTQSRTITHSASLDRVFRKGAAQDVVLHEVRALCPLPDTAFKIRCVAQSFSPAKSHIYLSNDATEAHIKALSKQGVLAEYRILHFATHGLLAGEIETIAKRRGEPALVMTPPQTPKEADDDGLLMASEVAQLKLNADWVILSACNTAAGDQPGAEALAGLARAFFFAGARALLVSHWPVYSDAAVALVTRTFTEMRDASVGRAEALRRAMDALIHEPSHIDNAHPSVWAPFVVVGEGTS
ncbi:MAG: hypothetical protein ETSY2_17725, partial [Candidatus Entotheonella gemina]